MSMYSTLEEAIEAAREEFVSSHSDIDEQEISVSQFCMQKYIMQDGDIMWQAEFLESEDEQGECLPLRSGEAAQAIFDDDFDETELQQEWQPENTLHEWDEGEFQLEPPADNEESEAAAAEWDDDNSESDRWI